MSLEKREGKDLQGKANSATNSNKTEQKHCQLERMSGASWRPAPCNRWTIRGSRQHVHDQENVTDHSHIRHTATERARRGTLTHQEYKQEVTLKAG